MPKHEDYQLRKLTSLDLEMVLNWRNSDRIRANMYTDYNRGADPNLTPVHRMRSPTHRMRSPTHKSDGRWVEIK